MTAGKVKSSSVHCDEAYIAIPTPPPTIAGNLPKYQSRGGHRTVSWTCRAAPKLSARGILRRIPPRAGCIGVIRKLELGQVDACRRMCTLRKCGKLWSADRRSLTGSDNGLPPRIRSVPGRGPACPNGRILGAGGGIRHRRSCSVSAGTGPIEPRNERRDNDVLR